MKAEKILKKVKEDYNKIATHFSQTRKHQWEEFDLFIPHLKNKQNLIDLGCGNGRLKNFLKKNHLKINYTGIDNSTQLLTSAQKLHPSSNFILGDMQQIPKLDKSADIITCIAAFHHLPTTKTRIQALKEMHRTLKDKGTLILTVWNLFQEKYKTHRHKALKKSLITFGYHHPRDLYIPWSTSGVNRYYYAFKPKELSKLLTSANFTIQETHHKKNLTFICQKS